MFTGPILKLTWKQGERVRPKVKPSRKPNGLFVWEEGATVEVTGQVIRVGKE